MKPRVTIAVPVYKGADLLNACFESLQESNPKIPFKLLVCDDGSPTHHAQEIEIICEAHGAELVRHETNRGAVVAYNTLLGAVDTDLVCLMDNDVQVPATWLAGAVSLADALLPRFGVLSWLSYTTDRVLNLVELECLGGDAPLLEPATELAGYTFMMARASWIAVRGFDEGFRQVRADSDFCLRLAKEGLPSYRVNYPAVFHQEHATLEGFSEEVGYDINADIAYFNRKWGSNSSKMQADILKNLV